MQTSTPNLLPRQSQASSRPMFFFGDPCDDQSAAPFKGGCVTGVYAPQTVDGDEVYPRWLKLNVDARDFSVALHMSPTQLRALARLAASMADYVEQHEEAAA